MEERKKVVFISGPITGVEKYWERFEAAEDDLQAVGYIPLSPAHLPGGMSEAAYMRICLAMIDSADAVLFLEDFEQSDGALCEAAYVRKTHKPHAFLRTHDWAHVSGRAEHPQEVRRAWLAYELQEVIG